MVEDYETNWTSRTLRTRELPGTSDEEVMKVRLSRDDLIALANQGLAFIEQQASEASGVSSSNKCEKTGYAQAVVNLELSAHFSRINLYG